MSAAGRGTQRKRHDAYATPSWVVWRLLEVLDLPAGRWLDPCAGDGAIIRAVDAKRSDVFWTAVEIRENCRPKLDACGCDRVEIADFFKLSGFGPTHPPWMGGFDVIITNPPYSLAEAMIRECIVLAPVVAMLVRVNFLASIDRQEWLSQFMPDVFVLPNRPSFTGGGTDATEYAWMVFERQARRSRGLVQILALTSKQERRLRA